MGLSRRKAVKAKGTSGRNTPLCRLVIAALEETLEDVRAGRTLTVRQFKVEIPTSDFPPKEVKGLRDSFNLSQPLFARILGVDVQTVQSWEQGRREPSVMARRFMDEIRAAPRHFRKRITEILWDHVTAGTPRPGSS
jgi:DNA-binding transcriptional regulator YiaG